LTWKSLQVGAEPQHIGGGLQAALQRIWVRFSHFQRKSHIVRHGHMWIQRIALKNHGNVATFGRHVVDKLIADEDFTVGHAFQP
jgi:hypothetical protein